MARAATGTRLHFGFRNLSLARERLYGGVGMMVEQPRIMIAAESAPTVTCESGGGSAGSELNGQLGADGVPEGVVETARTYAERAVGLLDVEGAAVTVESAVPRHVGLGSGTQLALTTLAAVARAHHRPVRARERAPALGRGGRSGVGVAGFEQGGFVVDAGHPTQRFTTEPPASGEWSVPATIAHHDLPGDWRFVLALPDAAAGRSGEREDESMRAVVERADPGVADDLARLLVGELLPAVAEEHLSAFGAAVEKFGRLNGAWYADQQGGVYRPPAGRLVQMLSESPVVLGAGQSSWGPAVYGVTDADRAEAARAAAREALNDVGGGRVLVTAPRNEGSRLSD